MADSPRKKGDPPEPVDDDEDEDEDEGEDVAEAAPAKKPPKQRPAWVMIVVALLIPVIVFGGYALFLVVYRRIQDLRDRPEKGVQMATKPLQTRKPWIDEGYFEIVPPIRMPASLNGRSRIEDWIKIPDGEKLSAKYIEAQKRWSLVYPKGTIVDRLEMVDGEHVVDVRGTELAADGEYFHVYRRHYGILRGYLWKRDDAVQQEEATRVLLAHAEHFENAPQRELDGLKNNNACGPCHAHEREVDRKLVRNRPNRGTDTAGFFMPDTTLADRAPLEVHRPREMNVDDEFIKFHCFDDDGKDTPVVMTTRPDKMMWPSCADGTVPIGVVDVPAGLKANDIHVVRLCKSRKALYERMDDAAKKAFADAFTACDIH
jgi:hypothetical protein